jgi:hypothetical protein
MPDSCVSSLRYSDDQVVRVGEQSERADLRETGKGTQSAEEAATSDSLKLESKVSVSDIN